MYITILSTCLNFYTNIEPTTVCINIDIFLVYHTSPCTTEIQLKLSNSVIIDTVASNCLHQNILIIDLTIKSIAATCTYQLSPLHDFLEDHRVSEIPLYSTCPSITYDSTVERFSGKV